MFYEILDASIDLSAVTGVQEKPSTSMMGGFEVVVSFADADPFVKTLNAFTPGDSQRSRFAVEQLEQALQMRRPTKPRSPWPYDHNGMAFDLRDVRMVEQVERCVSTSYETRNNRRPTSTVAYRYGIIVAGRPRVERTLSNIPDVKMTSLHHEHDRLVQLWLQSMEEKAA